MNIMTTIQSAADSNYCTSMREFYENYIRDYPDLLQTTDIIRITGFSKTAINNWAREGKLKAILYKRKFLFPKDNLLAFLTGIYYLSIIRKTNIQKRTLLSFYALYSADFKGGEF